MERSLNLLGLLIPLGLTLVVVLVAIGAMVVGMRARADAGVEAAGMPSWQVVLLTAVVALLLLQVAGYTLAFLV